MEMIDKVKNFPDDDEEAVEDFREIISRNLDKGASYATMDQHTCEGMPGVQVMQWHREDVLP